MDHHDRDKYDDTRFGAFSGLPFTITYLIVFVGVIAVGLRFAGCV